MHQHDLPPSTVLPDNEVMEILGDLFQLHHLRDYHDLIRTLKTKQQNYVREQAEPSDIQAANIASFTTSFLRHLSTTLHVKSKEASGYGMLSNFSEFVCRMMKDKYPSNTFYIDPQFKVCEGRKYTTDEAMLQFLVEYGHNYRLLIEWEYKPKVPSDLDDVTGWHLSETLLQAYYTRAGHSYPVLHCLTDLWDYHYFFIEDDGPRTLKLVKYVYLKSELSEPNDVWDHINFLFKSVNIVN